MLRSFLQSSCGEFQPLPHIDPGRIGQGILIAAIQLAVAFLIWFLFMKHYRAEAKRMNDRIQAMK